MKSILVCMSLLLAFASSSFAQEKDVAAEIRELREKLERLEKKMASDEAQKAKVAEAEKAAITEQVKQEIKAEASSKGRSYFDRLLEQTKVGGYGSMRYGTSDLDDLNNGFTFRRFVLTVDSAITERLKTNMELEFERFTSLELDKKLTRTSGSGGLTSEVAIEGTTNSEISLEQAWLQYDIADWLKFRSGAVLVPLGRFNINHDDNRWDLPRRSLVDRGVPVLPVTAAWPELGAGFLGDIPIGDTGKLSYQAYVMNGVTLNSEVEQIGQTRSGDTTKLAYEVKLQPSRGTFQTTSKVAKPLAHVGPIVPSSAMILARRFIGGDTLPTSCRINPCFRLPLTAKKLGGPLKSKVSM